MDSPHVSWLLALCLPALACSANGKNDAAVLGSNAGVAGTSGTIASDGGALGDGPALTPDDDGGLGGSFEPPTENGQSCGDGGVWAGDACCEPIKACGDVCCAGEEVCSFQICVKPGKACEDSTDCEDTEYCELALSTDAAPAAPAPPDPGGACVGGAPSPVSGKCLPKPPECDEGATGDGTCLAKCEVRPPTSAFDPVEKYTWAKEDTMMMPIVVQLDDDDCDGKVSAADIPEIAFVSFAAGGYTGPGTLHVTSIKGGAFVEKWSKPGEVHGSSGLAAADLDGDGVAEIVACMAPPSSGAIAYKADGTVLWTSTAPEVGCGASYPAIADPDGSGKAMVLVKMTLLDGATGTVVKNLTTADNYITGLSDIDGDGVLDAVGGQKVYRIDGTPIWDLSSGPDMIAPGYHAVGDFDNEGKPDVVVISSSGPHTASVLTYDAGSPTGVRMVRKGIDINNGISTATFCGADKEYGGGPPTVADFNGDGFPDVGAAGAVGYVVLDGKKLMDPSIPNQDTILWFKQTHDCSSAVTGSSVFDFNGDGKAEVIYGDEFKLWMYDGLTGENLISDICNTNGTLVEYPVIADVDNDGQADIVVSANNYAFQCPSGPGKSGIRVFGSATNSWVKTRRVWNEHTYHITNVNEDGTLPKGEKPNWKTKGLNNYRQNKQPGAEFGAADIVVELLRPECHGEYTLVATVRNVGQAGVPPGAVTVEYYAGNPPDGKKLGEAKTTQALQPAQGELVSFAVKDPPPGIRSGSTPVYAVVVVDGKVVECRPGNNTSEPVSGKCGIQ